MKRLLLLIGISTFSLSAFSQTQDLGSWMTFSFDKGLGNKFAFGLDQELRLKDNLTNVNLIYTNLGFSYKVTKFFKISTVYRFIDKHKSDGSFGIRHRFYTDLIFKAKTGKWSFGYRARLQFEFRKSGYYSDLGNEPEIFLRNLFKIQYKAGEKFSPYVGSELRWQIQDPKLPWANGFDRTRFFAGTDYSINKKMTAGAYYLIQKEWNLNNPQTLYIIGLEFGISID